MVILGCQPCLKRKLNPENAECFLLPNYCPPHMDSQVKTGSLHVADFHVEYCILGKVPETRLQQAILGRAALISPRQTTKRVVSL